MSGTWSTTLSPRSIEIHPTSGYEDGGFYLYKEGDCSEVRLTPSQANLIAAAPELLEALEDLVTVLSFSLESPNTESAEKALAKARGETL